MIQVFLGLKFFRNSFNEANFRNTIFFWPFWNLYEYLVFYPGNKNQQIHLFNF